MIRARLADWWRRHTRLILVAGLTVVAYLGALNRNNVQVWVIAALMLSTLLVGALWPRWMARSIAVHRVGPSTATEGEQVTFQVAVRNLGWLPRYMIGVLDRLPFADGGSRRDGARETLLAQVSFLAPRAEERIEAKVTCERRGLFEIGPVGIATSFPLGLAESRVDALGGRQTLTVYPQLFDIADLPLRGTPRLIHRGALLLPEGAGNAEFRGLREYRPGDSPKHIHWPTSARLNRLMVREFEPLASASLHLALDLSVGSEAGSGKHTTLEYAVKIAGSIARFACERGMPVRLIASGQTPTDIPANSGEQHFSAILKKLAVVRADGQESYADLLTRVSADIEAGENVVSFWAETPKQSERTLDAIATLRHDGAHLIVVLFDRESFSGVRMGAADVRVEDRAGGLREIGAHVLEVHRGDNLQAVLNT